MRWAKKEDRIDRLATSLCDCTSLFPRTARRRIPNHGDDRDRCQGRKEVRRRREVAGGAASEKVSRRMMGDSPRAVRQFPNEVSF